MDIERWENINAPGFEGLYQVSDQGNVRRIGAFVTARKPLDGSPRIPVIRAPRLIALSTNKGYKRAPISNGTKRKSFSVHQLVAKAFIGQQPEGKEPNHKNGDKSDNRVTNLEYVTHSENCLHGILVLKRRVSRGIDRHTHKLTEDQVREIRMLREQGMIYRVIGEKFGISLQNASSICNRKYWKHL